MVSLLYQVLQTLFTNFKITRRIALIRWRRCLSAINVAFLASFSSGVTVGVVPSVVVVTWVTVEQIDEEEACEEREGLEGGTGRVSVGLEGGIGIESEGLEGGAGVVSEWLDEGIGIESEGLEGGAGVVSAWLEGEGVVIRAWVEGGAVVVKDGFEGETVSGDNCFASIITSSSFSLITSNLSSSSKSSNAVLILLTTWFDSSLSI